MLCGAFLVVAGFAASLGFGEVGLPCGEVGFLCGEVGLLCGEVGCPFGEVGRPCGEVGLPPSALVPLRGEAVFSVLVVRTGTSFVIFFTTYKNT